MKTFLNKDIILLCYNVLIFLLGFSFSFSDKIAPLLLILIGIVSIIARIKLRILFKLDFFKSLFFLIIVYYIVRLDLNSNFSQGLKFIEKNISFLFIPLIIIPTIIPKKNIFFRGFVYGVVFISFYTILFCLIDAYKGETLGNWYFQSIEKYGFHPTYMAMYALISMILLDREKIFKNKKKSNIFIIFFLLFIFFTASRIVILATIVIILIKMLLSFDYRYLITISLSIISFLTFYFLSNDFQYKVNQVLSFKGLNYYDNNDYGSVSVRVAKIKASFNVWENNKWFGIGTGKLKEELIKEYRSKEIECWPCAKRRYNPHNQYLSVLAGHGVFGVILFATLIIYILYKSIKTRNYLLLEILLVFLTVGLTESILERQKGVLAFTVFLFYCFYLLKNGTISIDKWNEKN